MMIELILTATPSVDPGAATAAAGHELNSVWDFIKAGGPAMALIALCSLVALAVVVERSLLLRKGAIVPERLVRDLEAAAGDASKSLDACKASPSPLATVVAAGLTRRGHGSEAVQKAMEDAGRREIVRLRKRMRLLGGLPQVSTMLGLLGTIFGMITTFQTIAFSGQSLGKTELLAKGIFEAWTCTAGGLLVAIPVLVAFHTLMGRVDGLMVELDKAAEEWFVRDLAASKGRVAPATNGVATPTRIAEDKPVAAGV